MAEITFSEAARVVFDQQKEATKANAQRRAGQMFNDRLLAFVTPKLPAMVRGYAKDPWFRFALINAVSVAAVKLAPRNAKLQYVTEAALNATNDEFLGSFNFEAMIDELLEGIPFMEEPDADMEEPRTEKANTY